MRTNLTRITTQWEMFVITVLILTIQTKLILTMIKLAMHVTVAHLICITI